MDIAEAVCRARQCFPFPGYMETNAGCYPSVARAFAAHVPPGGRILDFGSGPCDKTAVLQLMGYRCTAVDDLQDHWHGLDDNRERILSFAAELGIDFRLTNGEEPPTFTADVFDAIMICDVLEHLHNSPRELLNDLLVSLRDGGHLLITVPNAVNLRKRINVLFGKTNLPDYASFYWHPGAWRGHVREYVTNDLAMLTQYLRLEPVLLHGCDHMLTRLPRVARSIYAALTDFCPNTKDTLLLLARKPAGWQPLRELPADEWNRTIGRFTSYCGEASAADSEPAVPRAA